MISCSFYFFTQTSCPLWFSNTFETSDPQKSVGTGSGKAPTRWGSGGHRGALGATSTRCLSLPSGGLEVHQRWKWRPAANRRCKSCGGLSPFGALQRVSSTTLWLPWLPQSLRNFPRPHTVQYASIASLHSDTCTLPGQSLLHIAYSMLHFFGPIPHTSPSPTLRTPYRSALHSPLLYSLSRMFQFFGAIPPPARLFAILYRSRDSNLHLHLPVTFGRQLHCLSPLPRPRAPLSGPPRRSHDHPASEPELLFRRSCLYPSQSQCRLKASP